MGNGFIREDRDIKYLILYGLSLLPAPVTESQLLEVVMVDDGFGYFEFSSAFSDLLESRHVSGVSKGGSTCYFLTPRGHTVAETMAEQIPLSVRDKADAGAREIVKKLRRDGSVKAFHVEKPGGGFTVKMRITDGEDILAAVELDAPTPEACVDIENAFREKAEKIYQYLLSELSAV